MAQDGHDPLKGAAIILDTGGIPRTGLTGRAVETVHWVVAQHGGAAAPNNGGAQKVDGTRRTPMVVRRMLPADKVYEEAARIIKAGGLVAFPTETVYGLGADAGNERALRAIYAAKGRPADNPLIAHVAKIAHLSALCPAVPPLAQDLMAAFWPGPLTITLPVSASVPRALTAGLPHVAVRMPRHPVALALIEAVDAPVAAPSANLSGRPSPTLARHVLGDLAGRIEGVIDGGPCEVGIESTVVELAPDGGIVILRPGAIGPDDLRRFGVPISYDAAVFAAGDAAPRAPGQKYRHYAPHAPVLLLRGRMQSAARAELARLTLQLAASGANVAALTVSADQAPEGARLWLPLSRTAAVGEVTRELYRALRACDDEGVDHIVLEGISGDDAATAVMNRMIKAAGNRVVDV